MISKNKTEILKYFLKADWQQLLQPNGLFVWTCTVAGLVKTYLSRSFQFLQLPTMLLKITIPYI